MSFKALINISPSREHPESCGDCERAISYRVMGNFICGVWLEHLDGGDNGFERCPQCVAAERASVQLQ